MSTPATPREGGPASTTRYRHRFANADYDEATGELKVDGQAVSIEPRPLRLLAELLRHVNEAVTKEELLDAVWDGRITVDNVLTNAVNKLRAALGKAASAHIVNLPRVGYRILGPVERTVVGQPDALALELRAGQPVPGRESFVLRRSLGSGGRGNVWLAQHTVLAPSAAAGELRVFKFAADADGLRALKREFTLFRVLKAELGDRPGFAQVIDANFAESPYHLECAYGGPDLLAWAAEGERLKALSTPERLALFLPIAQAVAAAHSVGVLHKDLKPANVLVGGQAGAWLPVLTDFGSGHAIDPERLRQLGVTAMGLTLTHGISADTTLGTAMYLAPEVQGGQASTVQSDLYALGLMLYQLLAGDLRRPMSTGWQRDIGDELLCEDIAAATEGQPQARLGSVSALVERLANVEDRRAQRRQAQLDAQRVLAAAADADKRRVRRPWLVGLAASLIAGLTASLAFGLQANLALGKAEQQSARATSISRFMVEDMFRGVGVEHVGDDGKVSMPKLLDQASQRAEVRFKDHPQNHAEAVFAIAQLYYRVSRYPEALAHYRRALGLMESVANDTAAARQHTKMRLNLANILADLNQGSEAKALIDLAGPDPSKDPVESSDPLAHAFAQVRFKLALATGNYKAALGPGMRMVALAEAEPLDGLGSVFSARFMFGDALYFNGQLDKAEALYAALLQPPFDVAVIGEVQMLRAQVNLARAQLAQNKTDGLESRLIAARNQLFKRLGHREMHVAIANAELGNLYDTLGDFPRAAVAFREAHVGFAATLGESNSSTRITALNLAVSELNGGSHQAALVQLDSGRPWFVETMGGEQSAVVQAIDFERARALTSLGRPAEATVLLGKLDHKRLAEASPGRDWEWRLQAEKGRALIVGGQRSQGQALLQSALPQLEALGTPEWIKAGYHKLLKPAAAPS